MPRAWPGADAGRSAPANPSDAVTSPSAPVPIRRTRWAGVGAGWHAGNVPRFLANAMAPFGLGAQRVPQEVLEIMTRRQQIMVGLPTTLLNAAPVLTKPKYRTAETHRRGGASMIPGLRDSLTHRMSTELYQRHHDAGNGVCVACGWRTPCPARQRATSVIVAAGEDPRSYDTSAVSDPSRADRSARRGQVRPPESGDATSRTYTGYSLGGRGGRQSPAGYWYDRDDS